MKKWKYWGLAVLVTVISLTILTASKEFYVDDCLDANLEYSKLIAEIDNAQKQRSSKGDLINQTFGGAYINSDKELVVRITDMSDNVQDVYRDITENPNLIMEYTTSPYADLQSIMDAINNYFVFDKEESNVQLLETFVSAEVLDDESIVLVTLTDDSAELINLFLLEVVSDNRVHFTKGNRPDAYWTNHSPGAGITGVKSGRIGYPCYRQDASGTRYYGFVTCAHVANNNCSVVDSSNKTIGSATNWQCGGTVDAAFVQTNSTFKYDANIIDSSVDLSTSLSTAARGSTVYKAGVNGFVGPGTVVSNNATVTYSNGSQTITVTGAYKISIEGEPGDSGGPLVNGGQDRVAVYGITLAGSMSEGIVIGNKAAIINNVLGLSMY